MTRPTPRRPRLLTAAIIGVASIAASVKAGEPWAAAAMALIMVAWFGGAEIARRRGSGVGAAMSGVRDERTGRMFETAAARTAGLGYLAAVAWIIYGTATHRNTDPVGFTLVGSSVVFYANVAWINFGSRLRGRHTDALSER